MCAEAPARRLTLAAAASGIVLVGASLAVAADVRGLFGAALALTMVAIAAIDLRHLVIPNALNALALALGLANAALTAPSLESVAFALGRGALTFALFFLLRVGYRRLRGRDGLGLGDVKLAFVAGVWLSWPLIPIAIEIAAFGALVGFGALYLAGKAPLAATRLPFGLFFAPAIWLAWLIAVLAPALG